MTEHVIIVAGGIGKRMNSSVPKQFLLISERPVLFYTIEKFYAYSSAISIIVVLPESSIDYWKSLCEKYKFKIPHQIAEGGSERFFSVKNGLSFVPENSLVAIHDGVRPGVSMAVIANCFSIAKEKGNAVPVVPIVDSLRKKNGDKNAAVDRKNLCAVQTPQCFKSEIIKKAYDQNFSEVFTDDATVLENTGVSINLSEGNKENIKVTEPIDLTIMELVLKQENEHN
jgi:2-C-methyl-D-erythritol 4-phosphate cytidylyltransferase